MQDDSTQPPSPPKSLYKYFADFDSNRHSRENITKLISQGIIRLTGGSEVNDPFEANPAKPTAPDSRTIYTQLSRIWEEADNIPGAEALRKDYPSKLKLKKEAPKLSRHYKRNWEENINEILDSCGFYSLTETNNHPLMWAHYASSHKGLCIEFDISKEDFPHILEPIKYSKTRPSLSFQEYIDIGRDRTIDQKVYDIGLRKSVHWAYEKEWRFIAQREPRLRNEHPFHRPKETIKIPLQIIKSICFGLKASDHFIEQIKEVLSSANYTKTPQLLKCQLNNENYRLTPHPL